MKFLQEIRLYITLSYKILYVEYTFFLNILSFTVSYSAVWYQWFQSL